MNKKNLTLVLFSLLITQSLFAQSETALPCLSIKKACATSKKNSIKDCMTKILKGETVEGVNLNADIISKCKEKQ